MIIFGREEKRRALQFIGAQLNTIVIKKNNETEK
jgi:hypothetical protein